RAVLGRVEQESELDLRFFGAEAEQLEYGALHVGTMDADRPATDFVAIEYAVVTTRHSSAGVRLQISDVIDSRRGERMMQSDVALRFVVVFEHREIRHPQRSPRVLDEAVIAPDLDAQRAHEIGHGLVRPSAE